MNKIHKKYSPGVLSLLPLYYVGWSDNILSPSEVELAAKKIQELDYLSAADKELLKSWSDPTNPPSPELFAEWVSILKSNANHISNQEKNALSALGIEMAKKSSGESDSVKWEDQQTRQAIVDLEETLGTIPPHTLRTIFPEVNFEQQHSTTTDRTEKIKKILDGDFHEITERIRRLVQDPSFEIDYPVGKEANRKRTMEWCRALAKQGYGAMSYPDFAGGTGKMNDYVGIFSALGYHDLSLVIKFGVQFGLFGGSIYNLGNEAQQRKYLPKTGTLEIAGCFAMTETGHGSNVRELQTTATYESDSDEIVIHTPTYNDGKEYIGNAMDSTMASVFAQLIVNGKNEGVHAILVPIRNEQHQLIPGVSIEDCGYKVGLNGVDNGRIWFDQVKVPRENLLNRFGDIDSYGNYTSPIKNPARRFFTMLGTLVGGRVCVPRAGLSAAKTGLAIAVNHALKRRQFAPKPGQKETLLLDYPSHQRRLMPLLAKAYALNFGLDYLAQLYLENTEEDARFVETLAAGMRSYSTWFTTESLQECREACGGKGYLWENRIADLKADSDIFTTFEGDNTVLMQLVAKGILSEFSQEFHDDGFRAVLRMLVSQVTTNISERNPISTRQTDHAHLIDSEFQIAAFKFREKDLLYSVSTRMRGYLKKKIDSYEAFLKCQTHMLQLADAYVERKVLTAFVKALDKMDPESKAFLTPVKDLYALSTLEKNRGWFLEQGYFHPNKSKAIRKAVNRLCSDLRCEADELVAAFGVPDKCLGDIGKPASA